VNIQFTQMRGRIVISHDLGWFRTPSFSASHPAPMLSDLRYAVRSLGRAWGFTLTVVITLALGIGAAAAIFSVADWMLFKSDAYPEPERLAVIGWKSKDVPSNPFLVGLRYQAYREHNQSFAGLAAVKMDFSNVALDREPIFTAVECVSAECFGVFGFSPALGGDFGRRNSRPGRKTWS
jgi:putative ABC transport system permease protein